MVKAILAIFVTVVGYGLIVAIILLEHRRRKKEVAEIIGRVRLRKRTMGLQG